MDISRLFRRGIGHVQVYEPVDPPDYLAHKSGVPPENIIKLNGNENPYGPSLLIHGALGKFPSYHLYPDANQSSLRNALQEYSGVPSDHIIVGAGADELIDLILRATLDEGDKVIDCPPSFGMYSFSTQVNGGTIVSVQRDEEYQVDIRKVIDSIDEKTKVVFIASPNNPTGNTIPVEMVTELLRQGILVVIDETYYEFSGHTYATLVGEYNNLIVLRSFSKWAGLAGLRLGYGIMRPQLQALLMGIKQPYNINAAAEVALLTSLQDVDYLRGNVKLILDEREHMFSQIALLPGITPIPSAGNFLLCSVSDNRALQVFQGLASRGIFVRYFDTDRLRNSLRISVGKPEHTRALIEALDDVLEGIRNGRT